MAEFKVAKKRPVRKSPAAAEQRRIEKLENSLYSRMLVQLSLIETVKQALDTDTHEIHLFNTLDLASKTLHEQAFEVERLEAEEVSHG